jgi:hypothetical protein
MPEFSKLTFLEIWLVWEEILVVDLENEEGA